jgi:hypothetical protein
MSTIKVHPLYPFVRIGLAYDLYPRLAENPQEHVVRPDEWTIDLDNGGLDGASYWSEADAYAAVDNEIFCEFRAKLIERQIQLAQENEDWPLVLRLVDGRARAEGYRKGLADSCAALRNLREEIRKII